MSGGTTGGGSYFDAYGGRVSRQRARDQILEATEADLTERGIPIPTKPLSQVAVFWAGFLCGLLLGLLIGGIFWELT